MQHRTRDVLIRQHTQIINALRAHLAELGLVAAQGNAGVNELRAIVTDEQDTRLPIDARASVIVLAAQLEALESVIGAIEKRIKMQHRSSEASQRVEAIPGIGVIGGDCDRGDGGGPDYLPGRVRDFAAWIGLVPRQDLLGASRSSDRSPSREIATCGVFSSSGRSLCCGAPRRIPGSIPGSRNSWRGDPSRSWRWRSPTRWRAWPGRCWPMVAPIGRLSLLKLSKRGSARKRRGDVTAFTNCRGDEDIDAKRSRPSIGKPVFGSIARKERVSLFGTDQRITSGPAARRPHSKAQTRPHPNASLIVRFLLHRGRRPYMTRPVCDICQHVMLQRKADFRALQISDLSV